MSSLCGTDTVITSDPVMQIELKSFQIQRTKWVCKNKDKSSDSADNKLIGNKQARVSHPLYMNKKKDFLKKYKHKLTYL